MLSNRPYLLRAFYQWIVDSGCTPILVIDAHNPRCKIPKDYAEGNEIVFNISPSAIRDLKMLNEAVEFKASFSGIIHIISAPVNGILAIYAEENGEGIFFDAEDQTTAASVVQLMSIEGSTNSSSQTDATISDNIIADKAAKSKPFLKLVE